ADHGARRSGGHLGRAAQQHPDPEAALRQLAEKMAADEARGAGQGNQGGIHRKTSEGIFERGRAKRLRTRPTRTTPAARAAICTAAEGQRSVIAARPARARLSPNTWAL